MYMGDRSLNIRHCIDCPFLRRVSVGCFSCENIHNNEKYGFDRRPVAHIREQIPDWCPLDKKEEFT